jgi:hypothetical protein
MLGKNLFRNNRFSRQLAFSKISTTQFIMLVSEAAAQAVVGAKTKFFGPEGRE